ncbi:MAG: hypothetical protein HQ567_00655 [Candidatus Nealsonbacteria bacterium]|nr:hypothetical protein [Candidatus Nealsonbacteria bacterium]
MATYNLRRFSRVEIIKTIGPRRLLELLAPYGDFFAEHDVRISRPKPGEPMHYAGIIRLFTSPEAGLPKELADALYYIDEMATPAGMDSLVTAAKRHGLDLDLSWSLTPSDIAVQVWLQDSDLLKSKHAEGRLTRLRAFRYYQTDRPGLPEFTVPCDDLLHALERDLDDVFEDKGRGRGTGVFSYPREDGIWFLVRHGDTFRREGTMDEDGPSCVFYRPEKWDTVVYDPRIGELRVNAGSDWEKQLYRAKFGKHLFGSEDFFPSVGKYTLEPLRRYGEAALSCIDVPGIEEVRLHEIHYLWQSMLNEVEVRRSRDLFAAWEARGSAVAEEPRIVCATFYVKFADAKAPRSVVIRPSNVALYTRDADAIHVEQWLTQQGFILTEENAGYAESDAVLAVA